MGGQQSAPERLAVEPGANYDTNYATAPAKLSSQGSTGLPPEAASAIRALQAEEVDAKHVIESRLTTSPRAEPPSAAIPLPNRLGSAVAVAPSANSSDRAGSAPTFDPKAPPPAEVKRLGDLRKWGTSSGLAREHFASFAVQAPANPAELWSSKEAAIAFLREPSNLDVCRIGSGRLGMALGGWDEESRKGDWDLSDARLGAIGGEELSALLEDNQTIKCLDLLGNRLGPEGGKAVAAALMHNSTVTKCNVACNNLGPEGARSIAAALKSNVGVTHLNMGYNQLGSEGAKAIAEALPHNTTLTDLHLQNNGIGREAKEVLRAAAAPTLKLHMD